VRLERRAYTGDIAMISTSLRWIARLLFVAVLLALAAAVLGGLQWQPDVVLSVNGQAVTLPGVAWFAMGAASSAGFVSGYSQLLRPQSGGLVRWSAAHGGHCAHHDGKSGFDFAG
jgi:hypothetical protein